MTNINTLFNNTLNPNEHTATYSLSGHLEGIVGGYWIMGEGYDDVIRVYYNSEFDIETDVGTNFATQENLMAYVSLDHYYALVIDEMIEKFRQDTSAYGLSHFSIESFDKEQYYYTVDGQLHPLLKNIIWIDDSFLNDENIQFDFEAFEYIESGNKYLNPNHFSINQMVKYINKNI